MEKIPEEKDLLNMEEPQLARKSLLPNWLRVLMVLLILYLLYRLLGHGSAVYFRYHAMVDASGGQMLLVMAPFVFMMILKGLTILALTGVLLERKLAVAFCIVTLIVYYVAEMGAVVLQYLFYLRVGYINTTLMLLLGLDVVMQSVVIIAALAKLFKIRKRWSMALPAGKIL